MTLEVILAGRRRTILIERIAGSDYRVTVDGRPYAVDAVPTGISSYSVLLLGEHRLSHDATVLTHSATGEVDVHLRGTSVRAQLNGRRRSAGASEQTGGEPGPQRVVAPMPGKIVRMLVTAGDEVSAGQGLVIMEAMKMENELRSPKAGRVKEVGTTNGMPVEAGRVLVIIE